LQVFDFYNAKRHTEPAIIRARKVSLIYPNTRSIPSNSIPLNDRSADIVFLLSAVHEIRSHNEKICFLKECYRICKPDGKVIMVEHLRDFPNFVAFSVGFTHFFSRSVWKNAFESAGFTSFQETKFTPFMSIFKCSP
jgi:SAM-dependent methyltransferase